MKKSSNTETELQKSVAYKKSAHIVPTFTEFLPGTTGKSEKIALI